SIGGLATKTKVLIGLGIFLVCATAVAVPVGVIFGRYSSLASTSTSSSSSTAASISAATTTAAGCATANMNAYQLSTSLPTQCTTVYTGSSPPAVGTDAITDPCSGSSQPSSPYMAAASPAPTTDGLCFADADGVNQYYVYSGNCYYTCNSDADCGQDGVCIQTGSGASGCAGSTNVCGIIATGTNCGLTLTPGCAPTNTTPGTNGSAFGGGCFHGDDRVMLVGHTRFEKQEKKISELRVGDRIYSMNRNTFELKEDEVIMIVHTESQSAEDDMSVHYLTADQLRVFEHSVFISSSPHPSNTVQKIKSIKKSYKAGVYLPVTLSGEILVNGISASCYANPGFYFPITHQLLHNALLPFRLWYKLSLAKLFWIDDKQETVEHEGVNCLIKWTIEHEIFIRIVYGTVVGSIVYINTELLVQIIDFSHLLIRKKLHSY
ncbi:unnamed protein product, partial [Didymodactylos carnosus]